MSIRTKLETLAVKQTRQIDRSTVFKIDDGHFLINGISFDLESAIKHIDGRIAKNSKSITESRDDIAFILVEPPSRIISIHKEQDEDTKKQLIKEAIKKGLLLYFANVKFLDSKYLLQQPWYLVYDSIDNASISKNIFKNKENISMTANIKETGSVKGDNKDCPYCGKRLNSVFGRTNHIKSKHPEKFEEYKKSYV